AQTEESAPTGVDAEVDAPPVESTAEASESPASPEEASPALPKEPAPPAAQSAVTEEDFDEEWYEGALAEYEKRALFAAQDADGDWAPPLQGDAIEPMGHATFYEMVGRDDLASDYRFKRAIRTGIIGTGGAIALGSLIYGLSGGGGSIETDGRGEEEGNGERYAIAVTGVLVGTGIGILSVLVEAQPVSVNERAELTERYNASLMEELGLFPGDVETIHDERAVRERAKQDDGVSLLLAPNVGPQGSRGLGLTLTF
ncbi:MAG: hypothetical protein AAFQ82_26895, partial [Myxococcota bacterium]